MGSSESRIVRHCCRRPVLDKINSTNGSFSEVEREQVETTILDYLLEDCWRAVLDYVPLRDIMRSERVSRRWQGVMLAYLKHSRIGILEYRFKYPGTYRNVHMLDLEEADWPSFEQWAKKLGPSVVSICILPTKKKIKSVRSNCPNLETIMFIHFPKEVIPVAHQNEKLTSLRRLCFGGVCKMSDSTIKPFLANDTLEELELSSESPLVKNMTGQWLIGTKLTNLRSLIVKSPYASLIFHNFVSAAAAGQLNLTRLELTDIDQNVYKGINLALEKLPDLETLYFSVCRDNDDGFFKAVSRLSRLKHLKTNVAAADEGVLAVTRSCEELQVLMLEHCAGVTSRGLATAWRSAGARLTALGLLRCAKLSDDTLVAAVTSCRNLISLDVDVQLTERLLARAAAAWRETGARRALRLRSIARRLRNNDGEPDVRDIKDLDSRYPELRITFRDSFEHYYDWTTGDPSWEPKDELRSLARNINIIMVYAPELVTFDDPSGARCPRLMERNVREYPL